MKRIGVMTGGGDCPGLNAVIRAVVKTAVKKYSLEVVGFKDGYEGLIHNKTIPLYDSTVSGIIQLGGTILGSSNSANPFKYKVKLEDGKSEYRDLSNQVLENIQKLKLDGLICIGGDGTLTSAHDFSEKGFPVVGVPKTIDNDLNATDVTFGFDSALVTATDALDKLHTTGDAHNRVMILEVMGRYAGWIALRSGISGGADVILLPEQPYSVEKVCDAVRKRIKAGKRSTIIVIAEGAHPQGGEMAVKQVKEDSPDPLRLGGIGDQLARQIEMCAGMEARVAVLGHLQRGGSPSTFDRWLATRFGRAAVELLMNNEAGKMVSLRGQDITSVPLKDGIHQLRRVDMQSEEVKAAQDIGVSFGL